MFHSPLKVFSNDNFRYLTIANVFSMGGFWIQQITIGWLIYSITKSAVLTTLALAVDAVPTFVIGPIGGVIADLWDRRKLMIVNLVIQCVIIFVLLVIVVYDALQVWHLFIFVFLMGLTLIIIEPARIAMVSDVVKKERFYDSFAIFEISYNLPRILIPLIGGIAISFIGAEGALIIQAMLVGLAVYGVCKIKYSHVRSTNSRNIITELKASINIVREQTDIRNLYIIMGVHILFFLPFVPGLFPVYIAEAFGGGAIALGVMSSVAGLGAVVGAMFMASLNLELLRGRIIVVFMWLTAAGIMLMSVAPNLWFGNCFVFMTGVASGCVFVSCITLLQGFAAKGQRARVIGMGMVLWGLVPLGSWASGTIADSIGPKGSMMIGAVGMIFAGMIIHRYMIKLWNMKNPQIRSY